MPFFSLHLLYHYLSLLFAQPVCDHRLQTVLPWLCHQVSYLENGNTSKTHHRRYFVNRPPLRSAKTGAFKNSLGFIPLADTHEMRRYIWWNKALCRCSNETMESHLTLARQILKMLSRAKLMARFCNYQHAKMDFSYPLVLSRMRWCNGW